jgi:DNA-binding LacI/PurR family transcriptional regulator
VRTPRALMGRLAAEFLMEAAAGRQMELPRELPVQLMLRHTTAAPAARETARRRRARAVTA